VYSEVLRVYAEVLHVYAVILRVYTLSWADEYRTGSDSDGGVRECNSS